MDYINLISKIAIKKIKKKALQTATPLIY